MSAIEGMVKTILSALDIDVEKMKAEVTQRITDFEKNVETLNTTLIALHERTARIESKLDLLLEVNDIKPPTVIEGKVNERTPHVEPRGIVSQAAG